VKFHFAHFHRDFRCDFIDSNLIAMFLRLEQNTSALSPGLAPLADFCFALSPTKEPIYGLVKRYLTEPQRNSDKGILTSYALCFFQHFIIVIKSPWQSQQTLRLVYAQGPDSCPEELNLYARIILRTSYHIKYITKSFDQKICPIATFVNPIWTAFFSFHTLFFSISISLSTPYRPPCY